VIHRLFSRKISLKSVHYFQRYLPCTFDQCPRIQDPNSDPDVAQNLTKLCKPSQLSTHKISSKSVYNFLRYLTKILKSGVNPVRESGPGLFKDQFRTAQSSNSMASVEREPITGVKVRSPPPPEAECFLFLRVEMKLQICPIIDICRSQKITRWMNELFFNDASPTNLRVVTSTISTFCCPWIQTSLTCAPAQVVVIHLLHTDRM